MSTGAAGDFWLWSNTVYGRDEVRKAALALQDQFDLNVNILLWCVWSSYHFDTHQELTMRKAIDVTGNWNKEVTANIRKARRFAKSALGDSALYTELKNIELKAEKHEQSQLQELAFNIGVTQSGSGETAQRIALRNLAIYVALAKAARCKGFSALMLQDFADAALYDLAAAS